MSELNNDVTPLIFGRPKPEAAAPPEPTAEPTAEPDPAGDATGEFGASGEAAEQPAGEAVDEDLESAAEVEEPVAEQPAWLWSGTAGSSTEPAHGELDDIDGDGEPGTAAAAAGSEGADVTAEFDAAEPAGATAAGEAAEPAELGELAEDVEPGELAEDVEPGGELWSDTDLAEESGGLAAGTGDLRAEPAATEAEQAAEPESGEAAEAVGSAELAEDVEPGGELWSDTDLAEESGGLAAGTGDLRAVPAAEVEPATEPEASEDAPPASEGAAYTSELKLTFDLNSAADAEPSTYGHPEVDAAVERLAELDQLETADHVEVYEDAHHRLHAALLAAGKDEGAAADSPSDYA